MSCLPPLSIVVIPQLIGEEEEEEVVGVVVFTQEEHSERISPWLAPLTVRLLMSWS